MEFSPWGGHLKRRKQCTVLQVQLVLFIYFGKDLLSKFWLHTALHTFKIKEVRKKDKLRLRTVQSVMTLNRQWPFSSYVGRLAPSPMSPSGEMWALSVAPGLCVQSCVLCDDERISRTGVCITCDAGMCKTSFHVTWWVFFPQFLWNCPNFLHLGNGCSEKLHWRNGSGQQFERN